MKYIVGLLCVLLAFPAWAGDELIAPLADRKITQDFGAPVRATVAPTNGQTLVYSSSTGTWAPGSASGGVTQLLAGTGISLSPSNGLGTVTVTNTSSAGTLAATLVAGNATGGTSVNVSNASGTGDVINFNSTGNVSDFILTWLSAQTIGGYSSAGVNFNLYNVSPFSGAAEWVDIGWSSNVARVLTMKSGAGGNRNLALGTANTQQMLFTVSGGVQVGSPTGGDKGAGTLNATGLYVNGSAVVGGTATLGQSVNAGNVVNSVASSGQVTWTTGGTYSLTTPEIGAPSDQTQFIVGGGHTGGVVVPNGFKALVLSTDNNSTADASIMMDYLNTGFASNVTVTAGTSVHPGNITINAGATSSVVGTPGGSVSINGGSATAASTASNGGGIVLTAGSCSGTTSTGAGGALVFVGGAGGTTSGTGGAASFTGGAGSGSTSGVGGLVTIAGGAGSTGSNNNAAGGVTITSGLPSGNATANVRVQSGFTLASGTTAQTLGDRLYIAGHSVTMSNTTATPTTIAILNLPTSNSGGGCQVIYQLVATDGTNYNTATGSFNVSCSNKAGTVTATTSAITDEASNTNTGTLSAATTSVTVASQAVSIKIAPTFTVISPSSVICNVTIVPFGNAVTVTAQ